MPLLWTGIGRMKRGRRRANELKLLLWNALDPAKAQFFIVDDKGTENFLGESTPASILMLEDPKDPYSVVCSESTESSVAYPIDEWAGETVTVRLTACCGPGNNGVFMFFDDVEIR